MLAAVPIANRPVFLRQTPADDDLQSIDTEPTDGGGRGDGGGIEDGGKGGGGDGGGGDDRPTPWVTVATFSIPTEAHLARIRLEAESVDCLIVDEFLVSTNWLLSPAVGGIKLQVPKDQVARAREVLRGDSIPWDESEAVELARCSTCGLGEYAPADPPKWVFVVSLLLVGIPLLFLPKVWRCTQCGALFEPGAGGSAETRGQQGRPDREG